MYDPKDVVKKAIRDMKKKKAISIYGFKANAQVALVKILSPKLVMRTWIKQQKLDKKYKWK